MSFRIIELVLYGPKSEVRKLPFNDGPNFIVGDSKGGKTTILDIVDYCLGSEECNVPKTEIFKVIQWYGLKLKFENQQVFIARQAPQGTHKSSSACFIEVGNVVSIPTPYPQSNTNIDALVSRITRFCGIQKNFQERPSGLGTSATVRHALWFCMLNEDEIALRNLLFHKQDRAYLPQAMKDVLPFFLGMYDETSLEERDQVRELRKQLLEVAGEVSKAEELERNAKFTVEKLYREAISAGLPIPREIPDDLTQRVQELKHVLTIAIDSGFEDYPDYRQEIEATQSDLKRFRSRFDELSEVLIHIERSIDSRKRYIKERSEQHSRLKPLELLKESSEAVCPVCDQSVSNHLVNVQVLREQFESVGTQLTGLTVDLAPEEARADEIRKEMKQVKFMWNETQRVLDGIYKERSILQEQNNARLAQQFLKGRIAEFVSQHLPPPSASVTQQRKHLLQEQIGTLEQKIFGSGQSEHAYSQISKVNSHIREYAKKLDLDNANNNLRLEIQDLTVVADSDSGTVPLPGFGSSENYLAYHLVVYMSLQRQFADCESGVPRFLLFDQPSRPFFPKTGTMKDKDRVFLQKLLKVVTEFSTEYAIQVIIMEKAKFNDDWFRESVIETWNGKKLIPDHWLQLKQ